MKRNLEIIKKILMAVEASEEPLQEVDGVTDAEFVFHVYLLIDAGFIKGAYQMNGDGVPVVALAQALTWKGCEFIDNARNETVWQKAKEFMKQAGGTVSVEIFKLAMDSALKQNL